MRRRSSGRCLHHAYSTVDRTISFAVVSLGRSVLHICSSDLCDGVFCSPHHLLHVLVTSLADKLALALHSMSTTTGGRLASSPHWGHAIDANARRSCRPPTRPPPVLEQNWPINWGHAIDANARRSCRPPTRPLPVHAQNWPVNQSRHAEASGK